MMSVQCVNEINILTDKLNNKLIITHHNCKFCNTTLETSEEKELRICNSNLECKSKKLISNTKELPCGHPSYGIKHETKPLPCLQPECLPSTAFQTAQDNCIICCDLLPQAPCIQLDCGHIFHFECIKQLLEKKWTGARITFGFCNCPLCGQRMQHPNLASLLEPIYELKQQIEKLCVERLALENGEQKYSSNNSTGVFFNNKLEFALYHFAYYPCYECKKPYFGGMKQCEENVEHDNVNPKELICGSCALQTLRGVTNCATHGTEFITYKCRYCCKVAIWFCFGTTHFCDSCHTNNATVMATAIDQLPKCCGPQGCPSRGNHPQNGTEDYAIGCGVCISNISNN